MENINKNRKITIELPSGAAELRRCDDHFFVKARSQSIPIEIDGIWLYRLMGRPGLGLPQIYAALTTLFGPSGDLYDEWKGAFAFPFKLTVCRGDTTSRYLLKIMNFRSGVEPSLWRVMRPGESYRIEVYHAPFDDELSAGDIQHLIEFIYGFLESYVESMPKWTTGF